MLLQDEDILREINDQSENAAMSDVVTVTTPSLSRSASRATSVGSKKKKKRSC